MMTGPNIISLKQKLSKNSIGNKAQNLIALMQIKNINIPESWVIPWDWHQRFIEDREYVCESISELLKSSLDLSKTYAVRSSSSFEDSSFHSFAGLFKSILHVKGYQDLIEAVIQVWESVQTENVEHYLETLSISSENLKMAVIIQEMVTPVYSGVLFSNNPMTGLHEIVIEAVLGEGTALVQDGVTPDRWISRSGLWVAKPDKPQMPEEVAKKVLQGSKAVMGKIKNPVDLEWVWDGSDVYWVQMREITTLKDLKVYSNKLSKDMMPGMIHPLIWSINVPLINKVWLGILEEIVGDLPIEPEDLAKSFFHRSYFNMSAIGQVFTRVGFPSEGLEMMMGVVPKEEGTPAFKPSIKMLPLLPRLFGFILDKWRFERKIKTQLLDLNEEMKQFSPYPDKDISLEQQISEISNLYGVVQKIVYFNVLTPILVTMYVRMLERKLRKLGVDLLEFDLLENFPEADQYQPNIALAKLHNKLICLINDRPQLKKGDFNLSDVKGSDFEKDFNQFFENFGHISDNSNNFMAAPWRENPEMVLQMIYDYQAVDRGERDRIRFEDLPVKGINKLFTRMFFNRARKFTLYRDEVSKGYMYGYGLFRPYFLRLAEDLVKERWLDSRDDIFYLRWSEIKKLVKGGGISSIYQKIETRKREMQEYRDIELPEIIYGDNPPPLFSHFKKKMQGIPTSQGYFKGKIKIIGGTADFGKVEPDDIIVIPYSDVGWTPLFARAGAVIAESGGLLSHSSIIAREYQIPAVVSVAGCMNLKDGQKANVNGFTGEISLLEEE